MTLGEAHEHLSEWADLHRLSVEARSLDPGIFLIAVPACELRLGLALPWMERFSALIISARDVFADRVAKHLVRCSLEGTRAGNVPVHDVAAGKIVGTPGAVQGKIGNREVVLHAAANLEPVGIHRGNGTHVDEIYLV